MEKNHHTFDLVSYATAHATVDEPDKRFLERFLSILDTHTSSPDINVTMIESMMNTSHSTLFRKMKRLTGRSPQDIVADYRVTRGMHFLREGFNVSESAYKSGFSNPKYFKTCFLKKYGILPSKYKKMIADGLSDVELAGESK